MPASPARIAAFEVLLQVQTQRAYASELLHSTRLDHLSTQDRALCTQLVMGVLRWQSRLDAMLLESGAEKTQLAKFDPEVFIALRLGIFQLHFLERIPESAAVNESVELVKRARKRSATGLVNVLLRKAAKLPRAANPAAKPNTAKNIAEQYAHPFWLVERWADQFGLEVATSICKQNQEVPPTSLRIHPAHNRPELDAELRQQGIELESGKLMSNARRVTNGDITQSSAFRVGKISIQDEASQLVAALLGADQQGRILDCCAAPGGKASAMAQWNPDAQVIGVELHPQRALMMKSLLREPNVVILAADARHLPLSASFDRILVDAPCSGTGTLARNPEIKWQLRRADLRDLHARQAAILASAMDRVSNKGRVIYSTCSLEEIENEAVVRECLAHRPDFHSVECSSLLNDLKAHGALSWPDPATLCRGPFLQTLPGVHPCDGFFAAVMERD